MQPRGNFARRAVLGTSLALAIAAAGAWSATIHRAVALGDTRTLSMFNIHTKETITVTYKRDGRYDPAALKQLDHFMRDWRRDQERDMDPELIDHIWILHQELGSKEPVQLICGYRSAATNESLRRHGGGQARHSQHILGKAADITFPDVTVKTLRNSALVQEWGGVGYYPTSGVPFVHVDTGGVRMWPRLPRLELAALFPRGHTQYLPQDGKPITPRDYQLALAKGLVQHNTMLASAAPAAEPAAEAQAPAAALPAPAPILASYTPAAAHPPMALAPQDPASEPQAAKKHFIFASAGGGLTPPPAPPKLDGGSFPLYESAEVVGAPDVDEDHPEELSYVPFEVASLMTDSSVTYSRTVAPLIHPDQKETAYLFEDMGSPVALTLRSSSGYEGLAAQQRFSGHAVRSIYAEAEMPAPTRLAQSTR
jgi:uncharacterized protein YcbK (DUF882 family)